MKRIIILAVLTIGVMTQSMAQKFGHANFEEIVSLLPERAAAEKEVQDLQKNWENRLNSMVETYQTKANEFQTDTTLTPSMRASLRNEIADFEKRIQETQQTAYTDIETKQNELMGKMIEKVRKAAVEVGKADTYTYIFDSGPGGSVLYAGGEDVTSKIRTQLGL